MKRSIFLMLAMVVFGLTAYYWIHERRGRHIHDTYFVTFGSHGPRAAQAEYEAARRASEAARRQALFAIEKARFQVAQAERQVRESVDGIPVPIVPGTRVTVASPAPPTPPRPPAPPMPPSLVQTTTRPTDPAQVRRVEGRLSATEERAKADARRQLREEVAAWIEPEVPSSYEIPNRQLEAMIVGIGVRPIVKPYATVYVAEIDADFSDARHAELVRAQQQVVVRHRMLALAGLLGFVLICLATVSGYIRTDEATKGYYTNRLRMLAAAGVGAAGTAIYQMIS